MSADHLTLPLNFELPKGYHRTFVLQGETFKITLDYSDSRMRYDAVGKPPSGEIASYSLDWMQEVDAIVRSQGIYP